MIAGGTINEPLGRDHKDRVKQAVTRNGKEAITHYRVIERFQNHTHVKAILETGRTHQIRVHCRHAGLPIVGDPKYGFADADKVVKRRFGYQRLMLHAERLEIPKIEDYAGISISAPPDRDFEMFSASVIKTTY